MFPNPNQNQPSDKPNPDLDTASDLSAQSQDQSAQDKPADQTPEIHTSPSTGLPSTLSEPPVGMQQEVPVSPADQEPSTSTSEQSTEPTVTQPEQPQASTEFVNPAVYQPTVESGRGNTQPPAAKKPSKKRLILLIAAAVLIVLLGSATAVYALWYNNPQKVVTDALQSAATAKTTMTNGTVIFTSDASADEFKAEVSFTSKVHNVDSYGQLEAKLKLTSAEATSEFSGAGMVSESGAVYLKFNDVQKMYKDFIEKQEAADMITQDPKLSQSIQNFIKKIDGNWIKISQDDIKQLSEDYDYAKFKQCEQAVQNNFIQSKEQQQELRNIYNDHQFILLTQKGTTTIDGAQTNKYDVGFDVSKAYDAYAAYGKSAYVKATLACSKHIADVSEQDEFKKPDDDAVREQQQQVDKLTTEVYVTQFGHELKRLTIAYADNEQKTSLSGMFNFGLNQPVSSPDPAKSIPITELQKDFESIQEQLMNAALESPSSDIEL